jgi:hypothetical protein
LSEKIFANISSVKSMMSASKKSADEFGQTEKNVPQIILNGKN